MSPAGSDFSGLVARAATGEGAWGSAADSVCSDGRRHTGAVPTSPLLEDTSRPISAHTSPAGSSRLSASGGGAKTGDMQSGWPGPALLTSLDSALQVPAGAVQASAANEHSLEDAEPGLKNDVHGGVGAPWVGVGATPDTSPLTVWSASGVRGSSAERRARGSADVQLQGAVRGTPRPGGGGG